MCRAGALLAVGDCEFFACDDARAMARKLELHDSPQYRIWLDIRKRHAKAVPVKSPFTAHDVRREAACLYPRVAT